MNDFYKIMSTVQEGDSIVVDIEPTDVSNLVFDGIRVPLAWSTEEPPNLLSDMVDFVNIVVVGALMLRSLTVDVINPTYVDKEGVPVLVRGVLSTSPDSEHDPWLDVSPRDQSAVDLAWSVDKIIYRVVALPKRAAN